MKAPELNPLDDGVILCPPPKLDPGAPKLEEPNGPGTAGDPNDEVGFPKGRLPWEEPPKLKPPFVPDVAVVEDVDPDPSDPNPAIGAVLPKLFEILKLGGVGVVVPDKAEDPKPPKVRLWELVEGPFSCCPLLAEDDEDWPKVKPDPAMLEILFVADEANGLGISEVTLELAALEPKGPGVWEDVSNGFDPKEDVVEFSLERNEKVVEEEGKFLS